ncbi:menaquinone-dependent protoporphyrinogen IX dehydrogenase [Flexibacterium corallicola]|uniref:menaquinone-dependent protoporphyrinogen IX dehydrogenase n=1 Tax=Flexibacterium corallicola TaxID=3037259 RepID=UPI00286FAC75|nr:menaquinone-dependent protoporphyrinogen IX dehydrogenase [Pseudovibrio sp. M1P-2-3]
MHYSAIFASRDGQTQKITEKITSTLESLGHSTTLIPLGSQSLPFPEDLRPQRIILACPIRYGHHLREFRDFVSLHCERLNTAETAFISVNLTARKPEKSTPETNSYLCKFLERSRFSPKVCGVFAGALHYPNYQWHDRLMIQLIMKMTGGPTNTKNSYEFTDWEHVEAFARKLSDWT